MLAFLCQDYNGKSCGATLWPIPDGHGLECRGRRSIEFICYVCSSDCQEGVVELLFLPAATRTTTPDFVRSARMRPGQIESKDLLPRQNGRSVCVCACVKTRI